MYILFFAQYFAGGDDLEPRVRERGDFGGRASHRHRRRPVQGMRAQLFVHKKPQ